jgi:hypothetical protein
MLNLKYLISEDPDKNLAKTWTLLQQDSVNSQKGLPPVSVLFFGTLISSFSALFLSFSALCLSFSATPPD